MLKLSLQMPSEWRPPAAPAPTAASESAMRRLSAATKGPPSASDDRWRTARALAVIAWYRHRRRSEKLGGLAAARAWLAGPKGFASAPIVEKPPLVLGLEPQPLEVVVQVPTPTRP